MPFNVAYQPNYGVTGALAYQSGVRSREDEIGQQYTRIALQQLQQQQQWAQQRESQERQRIANERMAVFDALNNRDNMAIKEASALRGAMFAADLQNQRDDRRATEDLARHDRLFGDQLALQALEHQDRMSLRDLDYSRSIEMEAKREFADARMTVDGLTAKINGLALSDDGKAWWGERLKELERVDSSVDLNDGQRASAYRQWARRASEAASPRYQEKREINPREWMESHQIAPGTYMHFDPSGEPRILKGYDSRAGTLALDSHGRRVRYNTEGVPEFVDPDPLDEYKTISDIASQIMRDSSGPHGTQATLPWDEAYSLAQAKYDSVRRGRAPRHGDPSSLSEYNNPIDRRRAFEMDPNAYTRSLETVTTLSASGMSMSDIPVDRMRPLFTAIVTDLGTINSLYPSNDAMPPDVAVMAQSLSIAATNLRTAWKGSGRPTAASAAILESLPKTWEEMSDQQLLAAMAAVNKDLETLSAWYPDVMSRPADIARDVATLARWRESLYRRLRQTSPTQPAPSF